MSRRALDLREYGEREAVISLSDAQFIKWETLRWSLITAYHNAELMGVKLEVLPCMRGWHMWNARRVDLQ